ncbi:MAG: N-acetyltransferase [Candidatus Planktophila sp.]|nr:N-acetyltransferase [Candidatus Planktophila sp.]
MPLHEPVIETSRLALHHISAPDLVTLFENRDDVPALTGKAFSNPLRVLIDFQGPLAWRMPLVKADPACNKWFVRWIVLKEKQEIIGSTSFHGAPDLDGMVEIGLGIESEYQNQGFAKEALLGMWRWAVTFPEVRSFRYTVAPDNAPSIAVVNYFGFEFRGQQMDEIDGLENIYEMSAAYFKANWGSN